MSAFDPLDTCPYDPVHRIIRSKMQIHLTKCAKNHPNTQKKQCPFDARHIINPIEYNYHIAHCPARESVVHYKYKDLEPHELPNILPIETSSTLQFESNENWDNDPEVKSYNPLHSIKERPVVRTLIGASKAKRREFREQERRRIQELDNLREIKEIASAEVPKEAPKVVEPIVEESMNEFFDIDQNEVYKPLRRPKTAGSNQTLNTSQYSMNDSLNVTNQEIGMNASSQSLQSNGTTSKPNWMRKSSSNSDIRSGPISYSSMLSKGNGSNRTINNSINEECRTFGDGNEKEVENNRSFFNRSETVIDDMTKKVDEIRVEDTENEKKNESQNFSYLNALKKNKSTNQNNPSTFSRCAANFPALK